MAIWPRETSGELGARRPQDQSADDIQCRLRVASTKAGTRRGAGMERWHARPVNVALEMAEDPDTASGERGEGSCIAYT